MELDLYGIISEDDETGVYLFGSHQYALYFWTKAIWEERLKPKAQLIHIDFHADYSSPITEFTSLLPPEDIASCIRNRVIQYNSFIIPAISMGIVESCAFCCFPFEDISLGHFPNYVTPSGIVNNLTKYLKGEYLPAREKRLCSNILGRNLILDIDIDYFLKPNEKHVLVPKKEDVIIAEIESINRLVEYAPVTTIAISPNIGKDAYQQKIQKIFSKYFTIGIDFDKPMEVIQLI